MAENTPEFSKFLIVSPDKPEESIGFIQVKKGIDILPNDALLPVIIKDQVEHFLLVKKDPPLSPVEKPAHVRFLEKMQETYKRFTHRKTIDTPDKV